MKKRELIEPDLYVINKKLTDKEKQEISAFIESHKLESHAQPSCHHSGYEKVGPHQET